VSRAADEIGERSARPAVEDAVRSHRERWEREDHAARLDVATPLVRLIVWATALWVLVAFPLAAFWPITVTVAGRGYLQPEAAMRTLRAPTAGVVVDVRGRSGEIVEKGAVLASIRGAWPGPQGQGEASSQSAGLVQVTATASGRLEGFTPVPGDVVAFADRMGQIIPTGPLRRAVTVVQERQRALIRVGDAVEIDVDQLPFKRYGRLTATVASVSTSPMPADALADVDDLKFAVPEGYLVTLDIQETLRFRRLTDLLRPGMRVWALFPVRKTTILATLFPAGARS
jgi:multidrug efflux pump subunit AcrA (membrane-fusion protein)